MNFIVGRNNLAATVFVPYDCKNNCRFCTSKKEYKCKKRVTKEELQSFLVNMSKSKHIKDVVFTGGEPMYDIQTLSQMIAMVRNKNVYINTSLIKDTYFEFMELVNKTPAIKGVNISRHCTSFEEDCKGFDNIGEDWLVKGLLKPIKINIVLDYKMFNTGHIEDKEKIKEIIVKYVKRWENYKNVSLSFRLDYRFITPETLHTLTCDLITVFADMFQYVGHTFCDVCDSVLFSRNGQSISIHRGLEHSSFKLGSNITFNDVIMFPDGTVAYDWDKKISNELIPFLCQKDTQSTTSTKVQQTRKRVDADNESSSNHRIEEVRSGSCGGVGFSSCGIESVCGSWAIKHKEISQEPSGCCRSVYGSCGGGSSC